MLTSNEIQNEYIHLYTQLRKYIWSMDTIMVLAAVEIEVFSTFPNLDKLKHDYSSLTAMIRNECGKDPDLKKAVDAFQEVLDEYTVDAATATNVVNNLNYIEDMYAWVILAYDKANDNIRGSIRSRGPIVNDIASNYNGGGHIYASGVRIPELSDVDNLIKDLDEVCKNYKNDK